jgi:dihydrofolate synthase/folylpolyglutamate synthase
MNQDLRVTAYLKSFVDYEKKVNFNYKEVCSLEKVHDFFNVVGANQQRLKIIHIAGTKGKGSTGFFLANLLADNGYKVGLYTSPHIVSACERIRLLSPGSNGRVEDKIINAGELLKLINQLKNKINDFKKNHPAPTFFEVLTAMAIKYFKQNDVDFAVLETGLGGRLDATNVFNPELGIITPISYDHCQQLGATLEDIAYEKAGIIKGGLALAIAPQLQPALEVIKRQASNQQAELFIGGDDFDYKINQINNEFTSFSFNFNDLQLNQLKIKVKGDFQVTNAAVAIAAVEILCKNKVISKPVKFCRGLLQVNIPGRLEVVNREPLIVLDAAHNPLSMKAFMDNLNIYFPDKKVIVIFGVLCDKDFLQMLKLVSCDKIIFTDFENPRRQSAEKVFRYYKGKNSFMANDIRQAFRIATKLSAADSLIAVTGSFSLVGEAKKYLNNEHEFK